MSNQQGERIGVPILDADLQELERVLGSGEHRERAKKAFRHILDDPNAFHAYKKSGDLTTGVVRVMLSFGSSKAFAELAAIVEKVAPDGLTRLTSAREEFKKRIGKFPWKKVEGKADEIAAVLASSLSPVSTKQKLNTINTISRQFAWTQSDRGALVPIIRVWFSSGQELLLDSTMDWDDALFLSLSMAELVLEQMQATESEFDLKARTMGVDPDIGDRVNRLAKLLPSLQSYVKVFLGEGKKADKLS